MFELQRKFILTALLLGCLGLAFPFSAQAELAAQWRPEGGEVPLEGAAGLAHGQWLAVRQDGSALRLHRYRSETPAKATLLYLPGTFMNGQVALTDEEHNLWLFLARRGVDVFTLDYRTNFLPRDKAADPEILQHWTFTRFLEDVQHAARQVRQVSGQGQVFVAGFSRGVSFAYGLALAEPSGVAGVIALDGYFKHHAPVNGDGFDRRRASLAEAGDWVYDVGGSRGWSVRQALMEAVVRDPDAAALSPTKGSGDGGIEDIEDTVGRQLGEILFYAFGPGALANTRAGISRIDILARLMLDYDRYYPKIQDLESAAMAAWADYPRSSLDDALAKIRLPVIFFGSTGMGSQFLMHGIHSASLFSGGAPELHVLEGWGHLDILVAEDAARRVFTPLLAWIEAKAGDSGE